MSRRSPPRYPGLTGAEEPRGRRTPIGKKGPQCPMGPPGKSGKTGMTGPARPRGENGDKGGTWPKGMPGATVKKLELHSAIASCNSYASFVLSKLPACIHNSIYAR